MLLGWRVEILQSRLLPDSSIVIWFMGRMNIFYSLVFLFIMQNICTCLLLSAGINISLFGTFTISFIILYTIVSLMFLCLSYRFLQPSSCIIFVILLYFEKSCLTNHTAFPLNFFKI